MKHRKSYHTVGRGVIKANDGPLSLVLAALAVNLAIFVWVIYFFIKVAAHVDAWPF